MTYLAKELEALTIKSALKGDEKAFKTLYDAYKTALFTLCLRYSGSREEAEDMLQDSFIKIFKELNKFDRSKGSFYTWASKISVNTCLEHIRKQKISIENIEDEKTIHSMQDQFNVLAALELKEIINELQKMPPGYRTVFNLYFFEEYNHKEIADQLNITESTSKTQLMKSKNMLRNLISKEMNISNKING